MAHTVIRPALDRRDARGRLVELVNGGPWETALWGQMKAGAVMGNHYHKRTRILFCILRGRVRIDTIHVETGEKDRVPLGGGDSVTLAVMETHAIRFLEDSEFILFKSERFNPSDDDTFPHVVPE